ncbi:hypothetical protein L7F22_059721 [Adiantum nelumboides]|nr:hypothetical protein [Adiantum nelumboides]
MAAIVIKQPKYEGMDSLSPIVSYILEGEFPPGFSKAQKQRLMKKASSYLFLKSALYQRGKDQVCRRISLTKEISSILEGLHEEACGGHFAQELTVKKILLAGFGTPLEIVSDNGPGSRKGLLTEVCEELHILHRHSTPYYPQSNGLLEKANGIIAGITGRWPCSLSSSAMRLHGKAAQGEVEAWTDCLLTLVKLEWKRDAAYECYKRKATQVKDKLDKEVKDKGIKEGDLVLRMPRQKQAKQWAKAPYEVDELSTHEKSHITDEVLARIPAHIFIAKFKDEEGDNIKTTIMPQEIWTLHRRPEVVDLIRAVHLEQFFRLPPWGTDYMRAHELMSSIQYDGKAMLTNKDGVKVQVLITTAIANEALHFYPGTYDLLAKTKSIDNEKAFLKAKGNKYKYADMIYNELELPLRLIS